MNKLLLTAIALLILIGLTCCHHLSKDEQLLWDIFNSKEGDPPIVLPAR